MLRPLRLVTATLALLSASLALTRAANAPLPTPKEHFGFTIGDDYHLATYTQTEAYFKTLTAASDRLRLVDIGKTEEGRTQWMVVCTSPANLAKLEHYRSISQRLARAEGLSETEARALAAEGRAVVAASSCATPKTRAAALRRSIRLPPSAPDVGAAPMPRS
jgi:hypothetical protein